MPGSKEIRTKIKSVQNTRKITKAMEMVAASKMRKAQERMRAARPYADKIRNIAAHLAQANPEYRHPFLVTREQVHAAGLIVVTTDKGLCGGLNTNVLRMVLAKLKELQGAGVEIGTSAIGNKGFGFLNRVGANVVSHVVQLGDTPTSSTDRRRSRCSSTPTRRARSTASTSLYTRFINTMKQEPVIEQLLPLAAERMKEDARALAWDLHLRARRPDRARRPAGALRRGTGLPGGGREHGLRAERAHGRDEGRVGQREGT